jgi:hypothetical protein
VSGAARHPEPHGVDQQHRRTEFEIEVQRWALAVEHTPSAVKRPHHVMTGKHDRQAARRDSQRTQAREPNYE